MPDDARVISLLNVSFPEEQSSRRRFLKAGVLGVAGLALYSGALERHWIDVSHRDIFLRGLPAAFDGVRIAQLSDIHMDEFTEPFFLRHAIDLINQAKPDIVVLTGDYVSFGISSIKYAVGAAWQCANILREIQCRPLYAVLGNHDLQVGQKEVTAALTGNDITVLTNAYVPIERAGSRIWLSGTDDPVNGKPDLDLAVHASIRNIFNEPIVMLCHAPDYVDNLLAHPAGRAVGLMLSGHTHGGQIRVPLIGPLWLPTWGRKYIDGRFQFGNLQLYVNRGLGTMRVPFRFNCPPEITLITLHSG
ncbi:MAG: metallophosphoesterase [Terracidiphilus sp.]|jgi:predicted MPP superfamily phosphohydrolase